VNLFAEPPPRTPAPDELPLAERLRPASLAEFVGQQQVLADGELLHAVLHANQLCSLVLWGPPGTGKTTLARILAAHSQSQFVPFSAVLSGIKEVRGVMAEAQQRKQRDGKRTIVFVDEIHRFNRAQQDAFLPYVEAGDIVLIGATTENPSFALNAALLSRLRVVVLTALSEPELVQILRRGAEALALACEADALAAIARHAGGDARRALTTLEVAERLLANGAPLDLDTARRALQHKTLLYDKAGEEHFNLLSAFHKSIRNSDVQAALYWLLRMIESGEDPRTAARRMVVIASEDIGLADPMALQVALAAKSAFESLGLPEGMLAMA
jgi:putative ATPase